MMAVRAPMGLSPSTTPLISAFSPDSPHYVSAVGSRSSMSILDRSSVTSNSHLRAPPANYITSPQDPVAPSPISSDVTQFEDVDEAVEEEEDGTEKGSLAGDTVKPENERKSLTSPSNKDDPQRSSNPLRVDIGPALEQQLRDTAEGENEPQSVIHIPTGFGKFPKTSGIDHKPLDSTPESPEDATPEESVEIERARAGSVESKISEATVSTVTTAKKDPPEKSKDSNTEEKRNSKPHEVPMPPSPLQTSLPPLMLHDWSTTPRAQTRQDFAPPSRPSSSLASIEETDDTDHPSTEEAQEEDNVRQKFLRNAEAEISALRNALSECWTLCNTLASLSHIHRTRMFSFSGRGDMQEQAWKSCWKLCQNLYNTRDDHLSASFSHHSSRPTLDLCREFCAALFEVRVRDNEAADSVLRVSFELNNHLFNTHDRSLPEAFRERTLDFYITLCHRLMKQKTKSAEETDSLLKACWSLAEMLFSLRQNRREGKKADEELLGSAIQACWELCDLFREGWTQIRPERGTPRPSQTSFTQAFNQAKRSGFVPLDEHGNPRTLPETPTTIFEDTINTISPDEAPIPNILILGAEEASRMSNSSNASAASATMASQRANLTPSAMRMNNPFSPHPVPPAPTSANPGHRWASSASVMSGPPSAISEGGPNPMSATTVSTVRTPSDDPTLILLKTLFVKAAIMTNRGYTRASSDSNLNSLPNFVKNLPDNAFGNQSWQVSVLENYRKAIANDSGFRNLGVAGTIGERGRINAVEVARAVRGMTSCVYGFGWLRDLYRYVFGYYVEEALKAGDASHSARHGGRPSGPAASLAAAIMGNGNGNGNGSTTPGGASNIVSAGGNGSGKGRRTVSQ